MTIAPGSRFDRYEILSLLGVGGMGEVYLANDARLSRKVALKLLPAEFTQNADRVLRFEQEAKAASALNHPNIITIYEIGEADHTHFMSVEFIEGETLRQAMTKTRMTLAVALDVSLHVGDALSAAHAAGIVHRDIKPENIMLRPDGYIKVVDFGLAKLTESPSFSLDSEAPTAAGVDTKTGVLMGTVKYMSPEQVRGADLDGRSDIFSLGVVLYEMVAGRSPFEQSSTGEMIAAILDRQPPPLRQYAPEIPAELQRIISKALAKDRGERYQTIKDLRIDLQNLKDELVFAAKQGRVLPSDSDSFAASPPELFDKIKRHWRIALAAVAALVMSVAGMLYVASGKPIDSLAVLPFVNGNADSNMEYLSEGISESLINSLSQLPNLKVMSRSSIFRYKQGEIDAQKVGQALGVRAVLAGKVTQRGDDLVVAAELVDVKDNSHIWGNQYKRKVSDLVALQTELSRDISEKLRLKLSSEDKQRLTKRYPQDAEAYDLYLKGLYQLNTLSAREQKGLEYFERAIEKDPNYAPAYAGLAEAFAGLGNLGTTLTLSPKEAFSKAKEAALKAVELDDTLADAHTSLAKIALFYEWDWYGAEREFHRAIALNPNDVAAHHWYSHYLLAMGRIAESLVESQRGLALDPLDVGMNFHLGVHYYCARQYDQAVSQLQKALQMDRNHAEAHGVLGRVYEQQSRYREAIVELQKSMELGGIDSRGTIGRVYALEGQKGEARKVVEQLQEEAKQKNVSPYYIAMIYAGLGEKDQAFAWLEKAYADRDANIINPGLKVDPEFDSLRSDPRLDALLRRMGITLANPS